MKLEWVEKGLGGRWELRAQGLVTVYGTLSRPNVREGVYYFESRVAALPTSLLEAYTLEEAKEEARGMLIEALRGRRTLLGRALAALEEVETEP